MDTGRPSGWGISSARLGGEYRDSDGDGAYVDLVADAESQVSMKNLVFWPVLFLLAGLVWAQTAVPTEPSTPAPTPPPLASFSPTPQVNPTTQPPVPPTATKTVMPNERNAPVSAKPNPPYPPGRSSYPPPVSTTHPPSFEIPPQH